MANEQKPALDTNNVPDEDGRDRNLRRNRRPMAGAGDEPRGVERDIADADKKVRTGSAEESVRNTPPFADYEEAPFVEKDERARDPDDQRSHKGQ
jgi:hypothetical protein